MEEVEAAKILLRLQAHYSGLAGNKEAATDWIVEIMRTPDPDAIMRQFILRWDHPRHPRLSDWAEMARSQRYHNGQWAKATPDPPRELREGGPERVAISAAERREERAVTWARAYTARPKAPAREPTVDPLVPPLTYDEAYPNGDGR